MNPKILSGLKSTVFVLLVVAVTLVLSKKTQAQVIGVSYENNALNLAEAITGNGVQLLNPVITCADSAVGTYNIESIAGFPDGPGVVLSTGNIVDLRGPNLSESTTTEWDTPGDPLLSLIAGNTSFDACALEFDVVPVGDTLRFNFTFASEEYSEYVGTPFNDAFGFFISGPGITGDPGLGGLENISLIPGTTQPVEINTVNGGNPDIGFPPVNSGFFVNNPLGFTNLIQYDGWTQNLFAEKIVNPCDTFRLKLVIADVADREWDSAVFIEQIESNSITLSSETAAGIDNMIEGCNDGTVTFSRVPVTDQDITVTYFIGGTAENGLDYPQIGDDPDPLVPKTLVIPANQATATVNIMPFDDGITEGDETVIFYVGNPLCLGTIQDSLVFTISDSLRLSVNPLLDFICLGDSLTFDVESNATSFSWSPSDFLNDPNIQEPTTTPLSNTIYVVSASAGSCTSVAVSDIRVSEVLLSATSQEILCGGTNNGAIDLLVTGGESPFTYEWAGPNGFTADTEDISGLEPGTYVVVVTDRDGCLANLSVLVEEIPAINVELDSPTFIGGQNISCFQAADGQINATINGGTPPFQFQWDDPSSQTDQNIQNLQAGTYTLIVTDANLCTAEASITLTEPELVIGNLLSRINVACFGDNTGSATIEALGGTPPYTYTWNTIPPQFGPDATGLGVGFYTANIVDINGCVGNIEIEIEQPDSELSGNLILEDNLCNGETTGTATANISGGTPPYTFIWSSDPGLNDPQITNLPAGAYQLTVQDDNGCELVFPFNITQPAPITIDLLSLTDVLCNSENTGSASVLAAGGTAPLTYVWDTNPPTNGPSISNQPAGTYTVVVTDGNNCSESLEVLIDEPDVLSLNITSQINPLCFDSEDGSITVEAEGGESPYDYLWNDVPPTSGPSLTAISGGTYSVTATDANNCSVQLQIDLIAPDPLNIDIISVQNVLCSGENEGEIIVEVTGGTPDYTYQWNDPLNQTTPTASNLPAGDYTLTVTDENSCSAEIDITITEPEFPLSASLISTIDVLCFGENTGSATVQASGGSGSYSYQWNDPAGQETATASNLAAGNYSVSITDNNGCSIPVVIDVTIDGPSAALEAELIPSSVGGGFNIACAGDSTGTIDLTISGGTGAYDILWNLPGLETSTDEDLIDLPAGFYEVTVTDENGCSTTASIELTAPTPISINASSTPSLCFGIPTGTIDLEIFGGVPNYTVLWEGPNGFTSSDLSLVDLEGGVYELTITDDNGCVFTTAITVTQPDDLVITVDSLSDYNGFNTTCWDTEDGEIYITPSGGSTPYTFQWNTDGDIGFSDQEDVTDLAPGSYEVVLFDVNGCIQSETIELIGPDTIEVSLDLSLYPNGFNISCFGAEDGNIEATATGGNPGYIFTWTGSDGFGPTTDNPITDLGPGEYNVNVEDINGCMVNESVTLLSPDTFGIALASPQINGTNISCAGGDDGSIDLVLFGGASPFDFSWTGPNGFTANTEDLFDLVAGEYCVTVTDANDCFFTECITLTEPDPINIVLTPSIYVNGLNLSCDDSQDGIIFTAITGGFTPYVPFWTGPNNFTSNDFDLVALFEGEYCLTITDANGCTETECITLVAPDPIEIVIVENGTSSCAGADDGFLTVDVIGGDPAFNYSWTGPNGFTANTQNITDLEPGIYCLSIEDASNCTAEECFVVEEPLELQAQLNAATFEGGFNITCAGSETGSIIAIPSGGTGPFNYSWTGPDGFVANTESIENLGAGTYCVEITDTNNCSFSDCIDIIEPTPLIATPIIDLPDCGDGSLAEIDLNVSGGVPNYSFNWNTTDNTEIINVGAGTYTVIITDANGCSIEETIEIVLPSSITLIAESPQTNGFNIPCNGDNTGEITVSVFGASGLTTAEWTGPAGFSSTDLNISNLIAGTYCLTLTDELGCTGNTCIDLNEPDAITASFTPSQVSCSSGNDGALSVSVSGGVPTYTIAWTGPNGFIASGNEISGLEAGTYCAEITDFNGCIVNDCFDIIAPDPISISLTSPETGGINILCFGDNSGSIDALITGGTPPYNYSWTGPNGFLSSDENLVNIFAGTYCLTITDQFDCEIEECITLIEAPGISVDFDVFEYANGFNTSCGGVCDGLLEASLTGGAEPIEISWNGPNGFTSDQLVLSDLCAGTYSINTTDANGCEQSASITLTQPQPISIDLESEVFGGGNEVSCFGANTGSIITTITGGIGDLNYDWSGPDGFTSTNQNLENLFAGIYSLIVTDENGCSQNAEIELTQPDEPLSAVVDPLVYPSGTNIACFGNNDGSITTLPQGGTPPYSFNWNGPNDFTSDEQNPANLIAGAYTLVIEDANSCVFTVNITLTEPSEAVSSTLSIDSELLCFGDETGGLSVVASGGSPDLTINWNGPDGFSSDQFTLINLGAGTYTYVVIDLNGCITDGAETLTAPSQISISGDVIDAECETPSGTINVTVSGGISPYSYLWNTGDESQDLINVVAGTYSLTLTDDNECTETAEFTINTFNSLQIDPIISTPACNGDSNGVIDVEVVSGQEPVSYEWTGPNGFQSSGAPIENLIAGTYNLSASDLNGCTIDVEIELNEPEPLTIDPLISPVYSNGFNLSGFQEGDGQILEPQVNGGTQPYSYLWGSDGGYVSDDGNNQNNLDAGSYFLIVTDANLCTDSVFIVLTEPIPVEIPNGISPNGDGFNDGFTVRGIDGFPRNKLLVFNRWGNQVYEEDNFSNSNPWMGTREGGEELPEGTYFVVVELEGRDNLKGYLEIRR